MRESTAANELSKALHDLRLMARTLDRPSILAREVIAAVRARLDEIERLVTEEPSPSPMAMPTPSPPAPTSPDGAGAPCGPLASAAGGAFLAPACKACGSPRLRQSDTSDHPGVIRCDACGLVQAS